MTIVETALATDGFSSLVTAVTTAGLVETLNSDDPFTVLRLPTKPCCRTEGTLTYLPAL